MKAYVIKNKEGKYVRGTGMFFEKEIVYWADDIIDAMPYEYEKDFIPVIKDCTIVPITICEGDLEEENRVLKKALELACETIKLMCPKPFYICGGALADKLGIPMMPEPKDYDYFIQQAKEREKDEYIDN